MKKLLALVAVSFYCMSLQAQEIKQKQITVMGSVELKEPADQASLIFRVKGVGPSLRQAVEDANNKVKTIADRLTVIGVKEKNLSTSEFFSGENSGDKAFLSSSRDFKAGVSTEVKIDSLKTLPSVLYAISESQVESLSDILFSMKDDAGFKRKVRIAAAEKAREKAQDLLTAVGATLGSVISIEEILTTPAGYFLRGGRSGEYPNPFNSSTSGIALDESIGSGFFARTISISSQVRVTFEIK